MANSPSNKPPPFLVGNRGAGAPVVSHPHKGGKWQQLRFPDGVSDGLQSKWPTGTQYRTSDSRNYLCQLAQSWATKQTFAAPYTNYYLDRLPDGYACFETDQPGGSQVYKRLFGHPSGRFFDSIRRFETHFHWLLDLRKDLCECVLCGNVKIPVGPPRKRNRLDPAIDASAISRDHPPREEKSHRSRTAIRDDLDHALTTDSAASMTERSRRIARQSNIAHATDEEGTQNVWRNAIKELKKNENSARPIEIDVKEEDSMDWIAERELLKNYLTQIELQHSFIPRRGELVLWVTDMPKNVYIMRDPTTMAYKLYDFDYNRFIGNPKWRGGVIADIPSAASKNGNTDFPDLLDLPEKKTSMNTAGFRVETMPDPNDDTDKSFSKQYKYVPLRQIRPLSHWQLLLRGVSQKDLHPSVLYAITCMTSVSLVGKWRFRGDWPEGGVMARAIYMGSELITVGDTVRLLPTSTSECTEILIVDTIRLNFEGIQSQHLDHKSTTLCAQSMVMVTGKAFTNRIEDAYNHLSTEELSDQASTRGPEPVEAEVVKTIFRPVGTGDYGEWYPLHGPMMKIEVSYDQILGRLYEADAITLWSGQRQFKHEEAKGHPLKPDLSFDMSSIFAGRRYATKTDERLPELPANDPNGIRWLISDSRAQALSIASMNGLDVGAYHDIRNPETLASWRAHIRYANGEQISADLLADMQVKKRHVARDWTENYVSSTNVELNKRGRKPGSKLINGKIYSAAQLADMTEAARKELLAEATSVSPDKNKPANATNQEIIEIQDDSDTVEVAIEPVSPQRYRSRMAGAALMSSDEEDSAGSQAGSRTEDEIDMRKLQPFKSKLTAYESASADGMDGVEDSRETDESDDDDDNSADLSAWQSREKSAGQGRAPLTKSQIMGSVGAGHGSMIASVQQYDDYDEDSDYEAFDLDEWKNPRNARGGTEESEGGDYKPGESQ